MIDRGGKELLHRDGRVARIDDLAERQARGDLRRRGLRSRAREQRPRRSSRSRESTSRRPSRTAATCSICSIPTPSSPGTAAPCGPRRTCASRHYGRWAAGDRLLVAPTQDGRIHVLGDGLDAELTRRPPAIEMMRVAARPGVSRVRDDLPRRAVRVEPRRRRAEAARVGHAGVLRRRQPAGRRREPRQRLAVDRSRQRRRRPVREGSVGLPERDPGRPRRPVAVSSTRASRRRPRSLLGRPRDASTITTRRLPVRGAARPAATAVVAAAGGQAHRASSATTSRASSLKLDGEVISLCSGRPRSGIAALSITGELVAGSSTARTSRARTSQSSRARSSCRSARARGRRERRAAAVVGAGPSTTSRR